MLKSIRAFFGLATKEVGEVDAINAAIRLGAMPVLPAGTEFSYRNAHVASLSGRYIAHRRRLWRDHASAGSVYFDSRRRGSRCINVSFTAADYFYGTITVECVRSDAPPFAEWGVLDG